MNTEPQRTCPSCGNKLPRAVEFGSSRAKVRLIQRRVSAIRDRQTKDGWRLRTADLNDIDDLHALAASPLVYRYLFDGVPPDTEYITRLGWTEYCQLGRVGAWYVVLGRCFHAIRRLCRATTLSFLQIRRTYVPLGPSQLGTGTCPENGVDGDHSYLFVVTN
jgi:hypothetical protein